MISFPIQVINRMEEYWGEDAHEFRYVLCSLCNCTVCQCTSSPERWMNPPEAVKEIPGAWGNMLTFLAGQHACVGYRA